MQPSSAADRTTLSLVGDGRIVPCLDGSDRRYVNLDSAASTPALRRVVDVVTEFLPWYSSVHRGAGAKSQISTSAFEGARLAVRAFLGAVDDQDVVFVSHTTHAINLLSSLYEPGARILASPVEHHANMLPWRSHEVELLPFPASPDELLTTTADALDRAGGEIRLLAVTGASNVTGEVWPIAELAELAHAAGAEIFVDAAQLAPHRPIDLQALGVDHLAVSGHKLYAPFGAGALVARRSRLAAADPWLKGGGAVRRVTLDGTVWADPPDSHEAGSPNTIGAVALGAACDALAGVGMDTVAAHERTLTACLRAGLSELPGVHLLDLWPEGACDRLGVATFMVDGFPDRLLAQILAAEHGVGVRNGRFCAHPFVGELIRRNHDTTGAASAADDGRGPGAVRASLGVASCEDDVDRLLSALGEIITSGPAGKYVPAPDVNDYVLADDQRAWPELSFRLNTPRPVPPCG